MIKLRQKTRFASLVFCLSVGLVCLMWCSANAIGFIIDYEGEYPGVSFTWKAGACFDDARVLIDSTDPEIGRLIDWESNGHPSQAAVTPGPLIAFAGAYADCATQEIRTTLRVLQPSQVANASAGAFVSKTLVVHNETLQPAHVEFAFLLLPEAVARSKDGEESRSTINACSYAVFEDDYMRFKEENLIWESDTWFNDWTKEVISDSTGLLLWQKKYNLIDGFQESYLQSTSSVAIKNYAVDLNPGEVFEVNWVLMYQSSIIQPYYGDALWDERVIPEPGSLAALSIGLISLAALRKRRSYRP